MGVPWIAASPPALGIFPSYPRPIEWTPACRRRGAGIINPPAGGANLLAAGILAGRMPEQ